MAGREFETAEEADDWLGYALEQENQHIDKPDMVSIRFGLVN